MSTAASMLNGSRITRLVYFVIVPLTVLSIAGFMIHREVMTDTAALLQKYAAKAAAQHQKAVAPIVKTAEEHAAQLESMRHLVADAETQRQALREHLNNLAKDIIRLREVDAEAQSKSQEVAKAVSELHALIERVNASAAALASTGSAGAAEVLSEVDEALQRVQRLELIVGQKVLPAVFPPTPRPTSVGSNGGGDADGEGGRRRRRSRAPPPLSHEYFPSLARCDIDCSNHGMSVDVPGITDGCQCQCVAGWTGTFCQRAPRGVSAADLDAPPPPLHIPREREDVPPLNESAPGCKAASVAYYNEKYKSEEFRTDMALKFFWTLARNSIHPMCSDETQQVVVIDIGANVGEQLTHWEQEFLNLSHCPRRDTLLVLVEPNPQNLVVLNDVVRKFEARQSEKLANASTSAEPVPVSGHAVVVDAAMSHYNGFAKFVVNKKQVMGKHRGNERGSLNLESQDRSERKASTLVHTRVLRTGALVEELQQRGLVRLNYTIPLLKIDAEGFDPAVIFGSAEILPRTNLVIFECHKLWRSAGFTFHEVVEFFAKFGFQTYKMGMFYWIPVTPPAYWDDSYEETMVWSNCIAIRNGHPFAHMFSAPPPCL